MQKSAHVHFDGGFWKGTPSGGRSIGDAFIRRYERGGQLLWERSFADSDTGAYGVAVDATLGAVVTGTTFGALTAVPSAGAFDVFVRRYDSQGEVSWTEQVGTPDWDESHAIAVLADGDLAIAGIARGDLDRDVATGQAGFVMRCDGAGKPRWIRQGFADIALGAGQRARGAFVRDRLATRYPALQARDLGSAGVPDAL